MKPSKLQYYCIRVGIAAVISCCFSKLEELCFREVVCFQEYCCCPIRKAIHIIKYSNIYFIIIYLQRSALSVAANCCHSIGVGDFNIVADSIPILSGRLQHQVQVFWH